MDKSAIEYVAWGTQAAELTWVWDSLNQDEARVRKNSLYFIEGALAFCSNQEICDELELLILILNYKEIN